VAFLVALLATGGELAEATVSHVTLQEQHFRTEIDGKPVGLYTIGAGNGMEVRSPTTAPAALGQVEQRLVPSRKSVAQGDRSATISATQVSGDERHTC
jgi:hypothetical protein